MKKTLLSLVLMLMAGISAWADSTTIYEKALGSWAATDITTTAGTVGAWYSTAGFTNNATNGLYCAAAKGSRTAMLTYAPTENSIQTIDLVFSNLTNTGSANDYSYLKIGSAIEIQSNQQNQVGYVIINGTSNAIIDCNKKNYNRGGDLWTIHAVINTATNTLMEFTLLGNSTSAKNAHFTLSEETSLGSATYNTITIGTNRSKGSPSVALNSIKIAEEKQDVTTAKYTVKYLCGTEEVKESVTRSGAIDIDIALGSADTESFYNADKTKKYIYVSDDCEGKTITSDSKTVITVNFREAPIYTVSMKDNLGYELASASVFEGDGTSFYLTKFRFIDGVFYTTPVASEGTIDSYGYVSYSNVTSDKNVTVTYTPDAEQNVVFFSEAEDIPTLTEWRDGYTQGRMSNGAAAYGAEGAVITTLPSGKYTVASATRSGTTNFYAGDETVLTVTSSGTTVTTTGDEFRIMQPSADLTVSAGSYKVYFDYVIIRKTGEGRPSDPNDEFWTEALPILENTIAKATEYKAQVEETPSYIVGVNLFQYLPVASAKFGTAIDSAQYYFENAMTTEEVYERIAILRQAMKDFAPTTPDVNETYTLAVVDDDAEETLYLNIDGEKPVLSTTPSYLQFHEYVDELGEPVEYAYYLYNTPTRRYLGLANGYRFKNTNLVTDKLSPVLFTAYDGNIWGMGIQGIQTVSYNGEVFIYGSADYEAAIKGDEHAAENTKSLTWFIAREDAPEAETEAEEGDAEATATSINGISSTVAPAAIYSANGARFQTLQKGMNIVRYADGTIKKVMVK